jgi:phosphoglycolate phosphatase-like HAD superfamily hydrolase
MLKPLPNAIETVSYIHNLGIRQVVISNKSSDMIREEAARMGFSPYIEHFFGLNDFGVAKPDPRFFDSVVERISFDKSNLNSENLIFFGDSSVDINFAKNINAKLIFVGPDYILKNSGYNNSIFAGNHTNLLNAVEFDF